MNHQLRPGLNPDTPPAESKPVWVLGYGVEATDVQAAISLRNGTRPAVPMRIRQVKACARFLDSGFAASWLSTICRASLLAGLLGILLIPARGVADSRIGQPGDLIVTDYCQVEISASGMLDLRSSTGARLVTSFPLVQADYFSDGIRTLLTSDRQTMPVVEEHDDSIRLSAVSDLRPATASWSCQMVRNSPMHRLSHPPEVRPAGRFGVQ